MFSKLLPQSIYNNLKKYNFSNIYEIRMRRNKPLVINYGGRNLIVTDEKNENMLVTKQMIESVIKTATENSIYAYNYQIKQGFITAVGGVRLGIGGESVTSENFMPMTMKDICSINIRIPHEIIGCSNIAFKFIYSKESGIKNTLIISPPGAGKTTFLRDITRQISRINDKIYSTLIVDERFEIASVVNGEPMLDIGDFADIVSGSNKEFAFSNGIRALRPDVIITDELVSKSDSTACENAIMSGVKVIASIHSSSISELKEKENFKEMIAKKVFERYIVLSNKNGPGTYQGIFDQDYNCIYF